MTPILRIALTFVAFLSTAGTAWSMDKNELIAALETTAAAEADLVRRYPIDAVQETVGFLAPWTAWRVTVRHPNHPIFLHVVFQPGARAWVISRGMAEYELFREEAKPEVKDEASALEAARWFLRATGGKRFWLIEKIGDVPFLPEIRGDDARTREIAQARAALEGKVAPASVATEQGDFRVRACGLVDRTLLRYTVTVTRTGRITYQTEPVAQDLPVVWVR